MNASTLNQPRIILIAEALKRFCWKMRKEPRSIFEIIRYAAAGCADIGFCTVCDQPSIFVERDT